MFICPDASFVHHVSDSTLGKQHLPKIYVPLRLLHRIDFEIKTTVLSLLRVNLAVAGKKTIIASICYFLQFLGKGLFQSGL